MFFTRCPECHTTFRISEEVLHKAAGQVRCGRCSNIFNAQLELRESDSAPQAGAPAAVGGPKPSPWPKLVEAPAEPKVVEASADSKLGPRAVAAVPEPSVGKAAEPEARQEPLPDEREAQTSPGPAELSDPDPFGAADLWTLEPAPTAQAPTNRRWAAAAGIALFLLVVQVTNSFSAVLATGVTLGPLVRRAYAALGLSLDPRWDLDLYEVVRATAATNPGESGRGELVITARIRNRGTLPQPYPHVQLRLLDRWEHTVGKRAFAPVDYGAASVARNAMLDPGSNITAELVVVDPGPDAAGFEIDVCIVGTTGLRCAADEVFE